MRKNLEKYLIWVVTVTLGLNSSPFTPAAHAQISAPDTLAPAEEQAPGITAEESEERIETQPKSLDEAYPDYPPEENTLQTFGAEEELPKEEAPVEEPALKEDSLIQEEKDTAAAEADVVSVENTEEQTEEVLLKMTSEPEPEPVETTEADAPKKKMSLEAPSLEETASAIVEAMKEKYGADVQITVSAMVPVPSRGMTSDLMARGSGAWKRMFLASFDFVTTDGRAGEGKTQLLLDGLEGLSVLNLSLHGKPVFDKSARVLVSNASEIAQENVRFAEPAEESRLADENTVYTYPAGPLNPYTEAPQEADSREAVFDSEDTNSEIGAAIAVIPDDAPPEDGTGVIPVDEAPEERIENSFTAENTEMKMMAEEKPVEEAITEPDDALLEDGSGVIPVDAAPEEKTETVFTAESVELKIMSEEKPAEEAIAEPEAVLGVIPVEMADAIKDPSMETTAEVPETLWAKPVSFEVKEEAAPYVEKESAFLIKNVSSSAGSEEAAVTLTLTAAPVREFVAKVQSFRQEYRLTAANLPELGRNAASAFRDVQAIIKDEMKMAIEQKKSEMKQAIAETSSNYDRKIEEEKSKSERGFSPVPRKIESVRALRRSKDEEISTMKQNLESSLQKIREDARNRASQFKTLHQNADRVIRDYQLAFKAGTLFTMTPAASQGGTLLTADQDREDLLLG